jgi:predicted naringenin-chalcone synthase
MTTYLYSREVYQMISFWKEKELEALLENYLKTQQHMLVDRGTRFTIAQLTRTLGLNAKETKLQWQKLANFGSLKHQCIRQASTLPEKYLLV